jgi:hypothetical protein
VVVKEAIVVVREAVVVRGVVGHDVAVLAVLQSSVYTNLILSLYHSKGPLDKLTLYIYVQ